MDYIKRYWIILIIITSLLVSGNNHTKPANTEEKISPTPSDTSYINQLFDKALAFAYKAQFDSSSFYFQKTSKLYQISNNFEKSVECLNYVAENFRHQGKHDSALVYLDRALEIAQTNLDNKSFAVSKNYYFRSIYHIIQGNYPKALDFINKSHTILINHYKEKEDEISENYNIFSVVYRRMGDYDKALEALHQSLSIKNRILGEDHTNVGSLYNNMGNIYRDKGYYDEAIECYKKTLSIQHKHLEKDHSAFITYYNNIGLTYNYIKDYEKAIDYYKRALSIALKKFGKKHSYIGTLYGNLGLLYYDLKKFDEALMYYKKQLVLFLNIYGEDNIHIADAYINLGSVFRAKKQYEKSLKYFNQSLQLQMKFLDMKHPKIAMSYKNIGLIHKRKNEFNQAMRYYQKALAIQLEAYGSKSQQLSETYRVLGELNENKDILQALKYYQESLIANVVDFSNGDIYSNPELNNILSENELLLTLKQKAKALNTLYDKSYNIDDFQVSVSTYETAADLIDRMRHGYPSRSTQILLSEQSYSIYHDAIETIFNHITNIDDDELKIKAFTFAEKSKLGALRQALIESKAKQLSHIPDQLLKKDRQIQLDLSYYEKKIYEEKLKKEKADSSKIALFEYKRFYLKQEYDNLLDQIEKKYTKYYDLKHQAKIVSVNYIQRNLLDDNSIIVEYFIGDSNIYAFTISKSNIHTYKMQKDINFDNHIKTMRSALIERDYTLYTSNAYLLYQAIIQPIEPHIKNKNLIIIPDGILGYVPFETLITKQPESKKPDYQQLAYLIKDHQISYHYSATILYENRKQGRKRPKENYLGFAPVVFK